MKKTIIAFLLLAQVPCFGVEPESEKLQEDTKRTERMHELEHLIVQLINKGELYAVEAAVKEIAERPIKEIYKMIRNGDTAAVELAIAKGFDVNSKNSNGFTPLTEALREYTLCAIWLEVENAPVKRVVNLLLKSGANPNTPYTWVNAGESGTPLELGVASCDENIVEMLLKAGADISVLKNIEKSVSYCSEKQKKNITALLEQHKS